MGETLTHTEMERERERESGQCGTPLPLTLPKERKVSAKGVKSLTLQQSLEQDTPCNVRGAVAVAQCRVGFSTILPEEAGSGDMHQGCL